MNVISSKGDHKTFEKTITRILRQAKQETDLEKRLKTNSPEYKSAIEKRAMDLAKAEKRRLSMKFNVTTGDEFYRLFELDLKEFIEKLENK